MDLDSVGTSPPQFIGGRRIMRKKSRKSVVEDDPSQDDRGARIKLTTFRGPVRRSIRLICKDLAQTHSTEIAMRLREGLFSRNLLTSLKFLTFVGDRSDGKPVETHRMVGLQDGPAGTYDLTKLDPKDQKTLLQLLRKAKDQTEPSSDGGPK